MDNPEIPPQTLANWAKSRYGNSIKIRLKLRGMDIFRLSEDWDRIIEDFLQSGLSQKEYSLENGLNYWTFREHRLFSLPKNTAEAKQNSTLRELATPTGI